MARKKKRKGDVVSGSSTMGQDYDGIKEWSCVGAATEEEPLVLLG